MRKALVLAAGLAVLATSAWSQTSSRDRDDYDRGDWRDGRGGWSRDSDDYRGRPMMHDEDGGGRGRGARFFVRSGDTRLGVICDQRESTRACVDAALTMFDR